MKIYIKYMVSHRCRMTVEAELIKLGIRYKSIELGLVETVDEIEAEQLGVLKQNLLKSRLELMDNKRSILVEKIKNVVVEMVHQAGDIPNVKFSDYLGEKLDHDYTYLANTFSEVNGVTIQQFMILHKIERVKELLLYDELSLTEISYKLNYSSVAHLSNQFKKVTGLRPSFYKQLKKKRQNLENM